MMKYLMDAEGRHELERFARATVLLAFDFDGTLAPIVAHPDKAHPRPRTRTLLERLTGLYPCAVISGRARSDALDRLGNVQLWAASGNHGAEILGITEEYERRVRAWRPIFEERLSALRGILIEDKGFSISIHYRNVRDEQAALAAIEDVTRQLPGARTLGGKKVVNVVPEDAPHKGVALDCMRRWSGCDLAIFVGDDVTDEDAFALSSEEVLSIRVGRSETSRARYYLEDQKEIDSLLRALISFRKDR